MKILGREDRETGREYALRTIRDNIISLELAPGSAISENELAAQLGLSRTPVREAVIELAQVGVIVVAPQKRSVVAPVDLALVEQARFIRLALEPAVAEQACTGDGEAVLRLRENIQSQSFCLKNRLFQRLEELDDAFHALLFAGAGKGWVYPMIRNFFIHSQRLEALTRQDGDWDETVADHAAIGEAVERGDGPAARQAMERHLRRWTWDEETLRQRYPAYF